MRWAARLYHKALVTLKQSHRSRTFPLRIEPLESRENPTVVGTVYLDLDQSGTQEPTEPGLQGIQVRAVDSAGNVVETVTSGADGVYTLTTNLGSVRLDFGPLPEGLLPGTVTAGTGSTVQFVNAAANPTNVDLALNSYLLATNLYHYDDALLGQNSTESALVAVQYGVGGTPTQTTLATVSQVGSTWGLGYQNSSDSLFASSFMKRHAGFGPDETGQSPTTGGIYRITRGTGQVSLLIDLNAVPANLLASGDAATNYEAGVNTHPINPESLGGDWFHDAASFNQVGRMSLGGLALSADGTTLYVMNLSTRALIEVPLNADGTLDITRTVRQTPIPLVNPTGSGITNFNAADMRPFAVETRGSAVLIGVTYTGQTLFDSAAAGDAQRAEATANLRAFVYAFDPATGTFRPYDQSSDTFGVGTPEPVVTANLTYQRGYADNADPDEATDDVSANWRPWTANFGGVAGSDLAFPINPQPWLTDIAFDGTNMILGLRDRAGDQYGFQAGNLETTSSSSFSGIAVGDILRAEANGAGWTLETNGTSGGTTTGGANNTQGPGGGEFYFEDEFLPSHQEGASGGLAQIPGLSTVAASSIDPLDIFTGGILTLRNATNSGGAAGTTASRTQLYATATPGSTFGKANGVGDLEAMPAITSIQVGNRVYNDLNNNGQQEANEPGIANVIVQLFRNGTFVGNVVTDASGQFLFDVLDPNTPYEIRLDTTQTNLAGRTLVVANAGTNDEVDSDATLTGTEAIITFTTGPAGTNNHTHDVGFSGGSTATSLTLGNLVWNDANNNGVRDNGEAGVPNVVMELLDATGTTVQATATTDAQGLYTFAGLVPETYRVRLAESNFTGAGALLGFTASTNSADPETNTDDDNNGAVTGVLGQANGAILSGPIQLTLDGEPTGDGDGDANTNLTLDFGVREETVTGTLTLGDTVFNDTNNNGLRDGTETGVVGVQMQLLDAAGTNVLATATTDANGVYTFPNLVPGTYRVRLAEANFTGTGALVDFLSSAGVADPQTNVNDDDNGDTVGTLGQVGGFILSGPIELALGDEPTNDGDADNNTNLTLDFGVVRQTATGTLSLGDTIFRDTNNNGVRDGGEAGITGVTVELLDATGVNVLGTTTSVADGAYTFGNLQPGTYRVRLAEGNFTGAGVLVGFTPSATTADPENNVDNDNNGATVGTLGQAGGSIVSGQIILTAAGEPINDGDTDNNTNLTLDFGVVAPVVSGNLTLGDLVFRDTNNNGTRDTGETAIPDVTVELLDENGTTVLATTTTNASGVYTFINLAEGTYRVRLAEANFQGTGTLAGFTASALTADPENNVDNDNNGSIVGTLGQAGGSIVTGQIILTTAGEPINDGDTDNNTNLTIDFGVVRDSTSGGNLSLGNTVWNDANNDGLLNNGETGIAGVTVQLLGPTLNVPIQSAVTDSNGSYVFTNLAAGEYRVRLAASNFTTGGVLAGFTSSTGTNGAAVGNFEGASTPDPDNNTDNDDNGQVVGTLGTTGTIETGVITLADGTEPTTDGDTDNNTNLTLDVGVYRTFSVGNVVFNDANNNGTQDTGELGIGGVEVRLRTGSTQIATATTNANGQFLFTNVVAGEYLLELAAGNFQTGGALVGFQSSVGTGSAFEGANTPDPDTTATDGDDNGTTNGSLGTSTGVIQSLPFTLGPAADEPTGETPTNDTATADNQSNLTVDFGVFLQAQAGTLTLGDTVFQDTNNNGNRDMGEPLLAGVTMQLLDAAGTNVLATAVTNASGVYTFANLQPGTYRVRVAEANFQGAGVLVGFTSSTSTADPESNVNDDDNGGVTGTLGQTGGFVATGAIVLALGQEPTNDGDTDNNTNLSVDFGFVPPAATGNLILGDTVFRDANNNGILDTGETGIQGVTVQLLDSAGATVLATTTTNASGVYTFANLAAGSYRVRLAESNFTGSGVLVGFSSSTTTASPETNINNDDNGNVVGTLGQAGGFILSDVIVLTDGGEPTNDGDTNNNTNLTLDFGAVPPTAQTGPLSLGNTIWNDVNNNGLLDTGETGIQNVVVELLDSTGNTVIRQVTTNASGVYSFTQLAAGDYRVRLAASNFQGSGALVGFSSSTGTNGSTTGGFEGASTPDPDTNTDNDDNGQVSGTLGTATGFIVSAPITLTEAGEPTSDGDTDTNTNFTLDFGVFRKFSIGNVVFNDTNNNGSQGTGEAGIGGVTVRLLDSTGTTQIATTTTDGQGRYLFTNLVAGDYIVEIAAGNFQTGGVLVGFQSSTGGATNPFEGASTPDPDTTATDGDDNGTTTGTLGTSTGFIRSLPVTLGPTANEPTGETPNNDAGSADNQSNLTVDFGLFQQTPTTASLSGRVFLDYNNSGTFNGPDTGLSGVTLTLSGPNLTTPITVQTDASGNFTFSNVPAGTYTLTETQPTTPANQTGRTTAGTSGGTVNVNTISNVVLTANQTATGYLFAEIPLLSTGGSVYEDTNGNGRRDTGENGIQGVTITLTGTSIVNGTITPRTTTTDESGNYSFADLTPGTYTLAETQPTGFIDGQETNGVPAATVTNDRFSGIDLTSTATPSTGFSFGEVKASSIAGTVYIDTNNNGAKDTGENGIANVTVRLTGTDAQGESVSRTATTDASGNYIFANLLPGTYRLVETQPSTFIDGIETVGTSGGTAGTNQFTNITLGSGVTATGYLFGEINAPDLVLTESIDRNRARPGQTVTLTFNVRNAGSGVAEDASARINLGGLTFLSSSSDSYDADTNTWTLGDMDPNDSDTLTITARVPGRGTFSTSARVSASNTETRLTNNADSAALPSSTGVSKQSYLSSAFFGPNAIARPTNNTNTGNNGNNGGNNGGTVTNPTTPTLALAAASDSGVVGDNRTNASTVTFNGSTTPGATLTLLSTGATTTADATGAYSFANVPLTLGSNTVTVRATNSTGGSSQASQTITRNTPPVVGTALANVTLNSTTSSQTLDLAGNFTDADTTNSRVRLNTSSGPVNIELFDAQAPRTVANFMNYINDGKYTDTIFHRSVSNFVVQGGGFKYTGTPPSATLPGVVTDPAVQNEPDPTNRSNLRGTLAMAKLGGDPNSATSQFFFNLGNNASNLDNQNGGFTVFGKLVGTADQAVVDAMAAVPVSNQGGAFNEIPLRNYTGTTFPGDATKANFVTIDSASVVSQTEGLTYTIVNNTNPGVVNTNIVKNRLTVSAVAGQTGTATITVRATDFSGGTVETTFTVTVS